MNIDSVIDEVNISQEVSQKTGKPYKYVGLKLSNGYQARVFLHPAEMAVIEQLLKTVKS